MPRPPNLLNGYILRDCSPLVGAIATADNGSGCQATVVVRESGFPPVGGDVDATERLADPLARVHGPAGQSRFFQ
jgi:phosphohistidine swiveling domain-containing protein